MERAWTEKEPLVPEWSDYKEDKKEQADGMPKLSLKLLYGMIQELKQTSDRLNARLDDFEHYMIEVQAARAQLEADAARTIARAKALAAFHERAAFAEASAAATGVAIPTVSSVSTASTGQSSESEDAALNVMMESVEQADEHTSATFEAVEEESVAADTLAVITSALDTASESTVILIDSEPVAAANLAEEHIAAIHEDESVSVTTVDELLNVDNSVMIDAIPMLMKPGKLESQPGYLMSLAQEVMGFSSPEAEAEDGLDPGEGANPFDPDSFAALETAEAQAASAAALPASHGSAATLTSPFFTPRSQRHPSSKKTILSLFGFRTRIS